MKITPMKAIRKKCLDCCCGNPNEVRACHITRCPLWVYRSGHRPKDGDPYSTTAIEENIVDDGEIIDEDI